MKVKRLHKDAVLPKYAKDGDSGFDLVAVEDTIIEPVETELIKTGLAFDIPKGYEIQVRPRSGITLKTKLRVQLGTIDYGYTGDVGVIVDNVAEDGCGNETQYLTHVDGMDYRQDSIYPNSTYLIRKGDRIAQAILAPVAYTTFEEVGELPESERGTNGYGSTGVMI